MNWNQFFSATHTVNLARLWGTTQLILQTEHVTELAKIPWSFCSTDLAEHTMSTIQYDTAYGHHLSMRCVSLLCASAVLHFHRNNLHLIPQTITMTYIHVYYLKKKKKCRPFRKYMMGTICQSSVWVFCLPLQFTTFIRTICMWYQKLWHFVTELECTGSWTHSCKEFVYWLIRSYFGLILTKTHMGHDVCSENCQSNRTRLILCFC